MNAASALRIKSIICTNGGSVWIESFIVIIESPVSASVMLLTSGAGAACPDVSSVCRGVAEALWNQPAAAINTTR